jgi:hypothetical protein
MDSLSGFSNISFQYFYPIKMSKKKKAAERKPSFKLMELNYQRVLEYEKLAPEMILHKKNKIDWDDMIKLELHIPSHFQSIFSSKNRDYLFNKKQATWKQIYDKLLNYYKKIERNMQKKFDENYPYYNETEHAELKKVIRDLKKDAADEDGFRKVLGKHDDYRTFDVDGFYVVRELIFNYCVNHNIQSSFIENDDEYVTELKPIDLKKLEKLRSKNNNLKAVIDQAATLLAPLLKNVIKQDKSCGESNFYSQLKRKVAEKANTNYNG